ncbi:MAG: hypothetical protein ABNH21_17715 [Glaciecola sp.]|jgi:hypothetical protein
MFKKLISIAALIAASVSSQAAIIQVDFTGTITSEYNNGSYNNYQDYDFGYDIGDTISDTFYIDTSIVSDRDSRSTIGNYYANGLLANDFISSNYVNIPNATQSYDYVFIEDDYYSTRDRILIRDYDRNYYSSYNNTQYLLEYLQVDFYSYGVDFISGDNLEQTFTINDFTNYNSSQGFIYHNEYAYINGQYQQQNRVYDYMQFNLTSITYNAVPAPAMLLLFSLSLLMISARKRLFK